MHILWKDVHDYGGNKTPMIVHMFMAELYRGYFPETD